jgi:hypothetical protein
MKRFISNWFFWSGNERFGISICEKIQGELILLHSYPVLPIDEQFFPENFEMVYDTVELTEFDMFKEEVPKLHTLRQLVI